MAKRLVVLTAMILMAFAAANAQEGPTIKELAEIAPGWTGEIVAAVDQSYVGWDVEIGDADNDGKNEILATGCPDSRLYLFKKPHEGWDTRLLAENLAQRKPGMGLAVRVVDLNRDRKNEIILGTGQEADETALFYVLETDGRKVTRSVSSRPDCNKSAYTHNLAVCDLDGDGVQEVISAYCGGGEVVRYDIDPALSKIGARKIHHLSGSGEESLIEDVDNDGKVEFVTSNGFRAGKGRVEVFEFDEKGELAESPRVVVDQCNGKPCFYASIMVGDVDNDGKNEMVVGWKHEQKVNRASVIGYRVAETATPVYIFETDTEDLDMAYFEKMMAIADANNDGKNELVISTRGDNQSEFISSNHLGHVFRYFIDEKGAIQRELVVNFQVKYAESSWLTVGDANNDGKNEIVLATGKGDRTKPGTSYVVAVKAK